MISQQMDQINASISRLEEKIEKLDDKADTMSTRLTVVETEAKSNKSWAVWLGGGVVTIINLIFTYYMSR